MSILSIDKLRDYLASLHGSDVQIGYVGELGKRRVRIEKELKGFGYGKPYLIEYRVGDEPMEVVLETMRPEGFGHDHCSDRAKILLWQHSCYNRLPRHARSIDVGAFTREGSLKSLGDCSEFFILVEKVEGELYHRDLDGIRDRGKLTELDRDRCLILSDYLVEIHSTKKDDPQLYVRRIRELVGHGECIMGIIDSYPSGLSYVSDETLLDVEKRCVEWRYKLKGKAHRLCQVHGDYHPWNILFREGVDFTALDRSRGEWGEAADDVVAMSINYIFYSLQSHGKLVGPFEELFQAFWENYMDKTGDEEMLSVVQPFFAWRALVIASPVWYPSLDLDVRLKLLNFMRNVLEAERFDLKDVNSYMK
ncbi:MAG: aminoglycoside phosphotransferase family protein [Candidatus Geothermarchaeales archaeon]